MWLSVALECQLIRHCNGDGTIAKCNAAVGVVVVARIESKDMYVHIDHYTHYKQPQSLRARWHEAIFKPTHSHASMYNVM